MTCANPGRSKPVDLPPHSRIPREDPPSMASRFSRALEKKSVLCRSCSTAAKIPAAWERRELAEFPVAVGPVLDGIAAPRERARCDSWKSLSLRKRRPLECDAARGVVTARLALRQRRVAETLALEHWVVVFAEDALRLRVARVGGREYSVIDSAQRGRRANHVVLPCPVGRRQIRPKPACRRRQEASARQRALARTPLSPTHPSRRSGNAGPGP